MPWQDSFLKSFLTDPLRLTSGKEKCPACGKRVKAWPRTLDTTTVELLTKILEWCAQHETDEFVISDVFESLPTRRGHQNIARAHILRYWGFIRHAGGRKWQLTRRGYDFSAGRSRAPRKVWVFNGRVVFEDDDVTDIRGVYPQWQTEPAHWRYDYIPMGYRNVIRFRDLPKDIQAKLV